MKKLIFPIVLVLVVLSFFSCGSTKNVAYFKNADTISLAASKGLFDAKIMPKDLLTITVSTTNPKADIQRRGRVLRLAEGKEYAEIYDFITLPYSPDDVISLTEAQLKRCITLVKNELNRATEFSRLSLNMVEAESILDAVRDAYSLNDFSFTTEENEDYGI